MMPSQREIDDAMIAIEAAVPGIRRQVYALPLPETMPAPRQTRAFCWMRSHGTLDRRIEAELRRQHRWTGERRATTVFCDPGSFDLERRDDLLRSATHEIAHVVCESEEEVEAPPARAPEITELAYDLFAIRTPPDRVSPVIRPFNDPGDHSMAWFRACVHIWARIHARTGIYFSPVEMYAWPSLTTSVWQAIETLMPETESFARTGIEELLDRPPPPAFALLCLREVLEWNAWFAPAKEQTPAAVSAA
jgi:hypothetical protein